MGVDKPQLSSAWEHSFKWDVGNQAELVKGVLEFFPSSDVSKEMVGGEDTHKEKVEGLWDPCCKLCLRWQVWHIQ